MSSSAPGNEDEHISQFIDVTGCTEERARFYLEASGWDTQLAIASFFEGEQSDQEQESDNSFHPLPVPPVTTDAPNLLAQLQRGTGPQPQGTAAATGQPKPKPVARDRGGMATLDSLRQQDDSSDEDDQGEAFFAGGSLTSGQQVLGPPKKKDDFIKDLFEKAKEHGATAEEASTSSRKPAPSFGGSGYKLGDSASSSAAPVPQQSSRFAEEQEPREVTLRLWSTGFTIDDGELRLYSDATNLEFLNAIKAGELPRELLRSHPGQEVQLAMEDRRHEHYVPPKVPANPFSGQGHMLGSPSPTVVVSAAQVNEGTRSALEENARSQINLSENEPMTNVQFRLADGTRLVGRFNHTHTVRDLHNFINTARPQFTTASYTLTLFPNTELTDMAASIKDANVLNAALIQKIKST